MTVNLSSYLEKEEGANHVKSQGKTLSRLILAVVGW